MKDKVGGVVFAAIFMVCFGAGGLFAGSVMVAALWEGIAAQDWVKVKAEVVRYDASGLRYRYKVGGRDYDGTKVGVGWLQSSDLDDEVDARLGAAVSDKKPITVFVNPDEPSESLVDPQIPWALLAFMTPFAFGFGGVGLGAAYVMIRMLTGADERAKKRKKRGEAPIKSSAGSEAMGIWIFAFFWNVISFPIALVAVPEILRSGEWLGLLVLIFPLVGVLVIWAAISATIRMVRRGPAKVVLATQEARMGLPLTGHVAFSRGVKRGDHFRAKLSAHHKEGDSDATPVLVWHREASVQAIEASDGPRVNFRFDVPSRLGAAVDRDEYEDLTWRLELFHPAQTREAAYTFPVALAPAPDVGEAAGELEGEAVPAGLPPQLAGLAAIVGEDRIARIPAKERARMHAQFSQMSPDARAQVEKLVKAGPAIRKVVILVIVVFVVIQIVTVVLGIVLAS